MGGQGGGSHDMPSAHPPAAHAPDADAPLCQGAATVIHGVPAHVLHILRYGLQGGGAGGCLGGAGGEQPCNAACCCVAGPRVSSATAQRITDVQAQGVVPVHDHGHRGVHGTWAHSH